MRSGNLTTSPSPSVQVFAIGGGGFTHPGDGWPEDAVLEDRLLALAGPAPSVRIGYIGHASNDHPDRITAFHERFRDCASATHLPMTADAEMAAAFLSELDIVYVGGGTTSAMLTLWQEKGLDHAIACAARNGLILSGVSAGAICWFEDLLLGTAEDGYALWPGMGLLKGSACPHYRNELPRKQSFDHHVLTGQLAPGIAIDDGVAVHIIDGVVASVEHARDDGGDAFLVHTDNTEVEITGVDNTGLKTEPLQPGFRLTSSR